LVAAVRPVMGVGEAVPELVAPGVAGLYVKLYVTPAPAPPVQLKLPVVLVTDPIVTPLTAVGGALIVVVPDVVPAALVAVTTSTHAYAVGVVPDPGWVSPENTTLDGAVAPEIFPPGTTVPLIVYMYVTFEPAPPAQLTVKPVYETDDPTTVNAPNADGGATTKSDNTVLGPAVPRIHGVKV